MKGEGEGGRETQLLSWRLTCKYEDITCIAAILYAVLAKCWARQMICFALPRGSVKNNMWKVVPEYFLSGFDLQLDFEPVFVN